MGEGEKMPRGNVYFIASSDFRRLKIGYAKNVQRRLHSLRTASWCDLDLYDAAPGSMEDEAALHALFKPVHIRGEWYRMTDEVFEFIDLFEQYRRDKFEHEIFDPNEHTEPADVYEALEAVPIAPFIKTITWNDLREAVR